MQRLALFPRSISTLALLSPRLFRGALLFRAKQPGLISLEFLFFINAKLTNLKISTRLNVDRFSLKNVTSKWRLIAKLMRLYSIHLFVSFFIDLFCQQDSIIIIPATTCTTTGCVVRTSSLYSPSNLNIRSKTHQRSLPPWFLPAKSDVLTRKTPFFKLTHKVLVISMCWAYKCTSQRPVFVFFCIFWSDQDEPKTISIL